MTGGLRDGLVDDVRRERLLQGLDGLLGGDGRRPAGGASDSLGALYELQELGEIGHLLDLDRFFVVDRLLQVPGLLKVERQQVGDQQGAGQPDNVADQPAGLPERKRLTVLSSQTARSGGADGPPPSCSARDPLLSRDTLLSSVTHHPRCSHS
jgi:hypothetical protein